MIVRFNYLEEFIEELRKDVDLVERRIVRITLEYRALNAGLTAVNVVATAVVGGHIVRLEHRCGETFSGNPDEKALDHAKTVTTELREIFTDWEMELRAGAFVEAMA